MTYGFRLAIFFAVACSSPPKDSPSIPSVESLPFTELQLEDVCNDCRIDDAPRTSAGVKLSLDVKKAMFAAYINSRQDWVCPEIDLSKATGLAILSEGDGLCGSMCDQERVVELGLDRSERAPYSYWTHLYFEQMAFVRFNETDGVIVSCGSGVGIGLNFRDVLAFRRGKELVFVDYPPRRKAKRAKRGAH